MFLQLLKRGLAYKKKAAVNWCPFDKTVLANEQVIAGECERCGTMVEQRFLEQWFFRSTRLRGAAARESRLAGLVARRPRRAQRNWIGRIEGAESASLALRGLADAAESERSPVFTTRPDTIFGATYSCWRPNIRWSIADHRATARARSTPIARGAASQDLVAAGSETRRRPASSPARTRSNPATGQPIPIWIADYV